MKVEREAALRGLPELMDILSVGEDALLEEQQVGWI